jgi:hypothetical protein
MSAAERSFEQANPAIDPEFISYFNEAELNAEPAHRFSDAHADQDDAEQACHVALDALRISQAITSERCASYVREFRQRLHRFSGSTIARDLLEQARDFTPTHLAATQVAPLRLSRAEHCSAVAVDRLCVLPGPR